MEVDKFLERQKPYEGIKQRRAETFAHIEFLSEIAPLEISRFREDWTVDFRASVKNIRKGTFSKFDSSIDRSLEDAVDRIWTKIMNLDMDMCIMVCDIIEYELLFYMRDERFQFYRWDERQDKWRKLDLRIQGLLYEA